MDTLGKRIAAERKRLGLTQDQLAAKLGVTAQAVSKWENDLSCPDISTLPKLAELFGTTTDALLGRETVHQAEVIQPEPTHRRWGSERKGRLAFAIFVILLGALVLCQALFAWDVSFWSMLWPAALLMVGVRGLMERFAFAWAGCALLGGYFLLGNVGAIDLDLLGGVPILSSVLLILGISLLLDVFLKKPHRKEYGGSKREFQVDGESFRYSDSFGEGRELVSMSLLSRGDISASFGQHEIDLSGVEAVSEDCRVKASCSFGELTILVPRRFRVQCDGDSSFASIETVGQPADTVSGTIFLDADCSFGSIQIRYI